ncbi:hypothetical protein DRJ25_01445 [Candidatus Woesearchaeota archaeon]|nr:MAG: hypothetical protein DRJ25_01445 [Candidatus Woesearchaeota archaeon]
MLRISLIGPGDVEFHFFKLLKLKKDEFNQQIKDLARTLIDADVELVLLPDRGVSFEIAKSFKESGGKRVFGTVPLNDNDFGINHLNKFIDAEIDSKKIFDELINTNDWYKQDLSCCLFGDLVLMLGNSLGAFGELVYGFYLYKLFKGNKPGVNAMKSKVHPEIRAGVRTPFSVIVYLPFFRDKLPFEIEAYIKKTGGKIFYVSNPKELLSLLRGFSESSA